jgi:hypothetical protein
MPYDKLFINLACSVCTEKYRTSVFLYKPRELSLYKKDLGPIFLCTDTCVRLIRSYYNTSSWSRSWYVSLSRKGVLRILLVFQNCTQNNMAITYTKDYREKEQS